MAFHVPEKFRINLDSYNGVKMTNIFLGNNGMFICKIARGQELRVIASDGEGWEHVSVSRKDRCPTWDEMCQIKALFWDEEDCVIQYHPPKSDYVSNHPYCLHLWRPIGIDMPRPPSLMVGYAGMSETDAEKLAKGMR